MATQIDGEVGPVVTDAIGLDVVSIKHHWRYATQRKRSNAFRRKYLEPT